MSLTIEQKLATAIAAATEFKQLLDVQRAGALFNPGGTGDARDSAGYGKAAQDLLGLIEASRTTKTEGTVGQLKAQITELRAEIIETHWLAMGSDQVVVPQERVQELQFRMLKVRADVAELHLLAIGELRYRLPYAHHSIGFDLSELCQRDSAPSSANTDITSAEVGSRSNKS